MPAIPEIPEKVLLFALDEAKQKMKQGADVIPFTALVVKDNLFIESHPGDNPEECFNYAKHTVKGARGAEAYALCYDGFIDTDDGMMDALIAEGGGSGGHVGELTTMVLVPQVCDVTDLPVIAAGGIADGRGVAAAFMLGACGVQLGTRFLSAEECPIHPVYKEKILKAGDLATTVTGKRLGHPVRSLRTNFARMYTKAEYSDISDEELENMGVGALRLAVQEGDLEKGCFLAGQIASMVKKIQPAAEIVREVMESAEPVLKGAAQWVK